LSKEKKRKKVDKPERKKSSVPANAAPLTITTPGTAAKSKAEPRVDPKVEALVQEIIGRVADKWTMVVLEVLTEHGTLRFTRLGELAGGVSQKMLTKTVRQMESDGLVKRIVYPVVPPRVEYELTELGSSLDEAFCGVWIWAEKHYDAMERARRAFKARTAI
jgi:DNA-binding HxlR family transcriptional regulator